MAATSLSLGRKGLCVFTNAVGIQAKQDSTQLVLSCNTSAQSHASRAQRTAPPPPQATACRSVGQCSFNSSSSFATEFAAPSRKRRGARPGTAGWAPRPCPAPTRGCAVWEVVWSGQQLRNELIAPIGHLSHLSDAFVAISSWLGRTLCRWSSITTSAAALAAAALAAAAATSHCTLTVIWLVLACGGSA